MPVMHKLMIVVTHLLGSGHLSRALALGGAFAAAGWSVDVVSGGRPAPHLRTDGVTLHQLPPLASDGADFSTLLTGDGRIAGPAELAERRAMLVGLADRLRPDVVITELFPFGRRSLAAEFDALLDRLRSLPRPPLVLASVRDILAPPSKPARVAETEARLLRFYDGVLVHSDPAVIPLERSWSLTPAMQGMLRYTGFVAPPIPSQKSPLLPPAHAQTQFALTRQADQRSAESGEKVGMRGFGAAESVRQMPEFPPHPTLSPGGRGLEESAPSPGPSGHPLPRGERGFEGGEVLVTAGGGPVGRALFEAATRCAADHSALRWRLLVAPGDAKLADALRRLGPADRMVVEPVRPDFRDLLAHAAALVGRCGYNTALDCLALGTPAVFCPFEDGRETEQATRADILAARPGFAVVREADLTPERLAAALDRVVGVAVDPLPADSLAGASRSVGIVTAMLAERSA